jgi:lysine 6-dehydrogenase
MNILILGAGMMGRAIAYDLAKFSNFNKITIVDNDHKTIKSAKDFLNEKLDFKKIDIKNKSETKKIFQNNNIAISAIPYDFNYFLSKIAIETKTHFIDLGGNNDIVKKQLELSEKAKENNILIVPDSGLAPGLTSVITKDIIETMDHIESVKIRVGGLPLKPKPPLNYQIVFSPNGLLNEYVEDSVILDNGKIVKKESMTEIEVISFPKPFEKMEAFLTSGGCSTLPFTYKDKIKYLDYKTIRYPGHCEKFKTLLSLGFANKNSISIDGKKIIPREVLSYLLLKYLQKNKEDVVLLKVIAKGSVNKKKKILVYSIIDYYDRTNKITAMMRTTAYPTSIIAQFIEGGKIKKYGVYCPHEIVPCKPFFNELEKRNIRINKKLI